MLPVGLGADPVVAQEHHGLTARRVGDVHQLLGPPGHEPAGEVHPVAEAGGGHPERGVVVAGVHEVLGPQGVAVLGLEGVQGLGGHRGRVAEPVHEALLGLVVEGDGEVVEEGGEAYHVHLGVLGEPGGQGLPGVLPHPVLAHVVGAFPDAGGVGLPPAVGDVVVHLGGVPHLVRQEPDGVLVPGDGLVDGQDAGGLLHVPARDRHHLAGGAVNDLPEALDALVAGAELLPVVPGQDVDPQRAGARGGDALTHEVLVDEGVGVGQGPLLVPAGREVGGVHLVHELGGDLGQPGAVGVAYGVGAERGGELTDLVVNALLDGHGDATGRTGHGSP